MTNEKYTSMISPTLEELQENGKYNRYELVIATSKCARIVTDEYVSQREYAERLIANKERFGGRAVMYDAYEITIER